MEVVAAAPVRAMVAGTFNVVRLIEATGNTQADAGLDEQCSADEFATDCRNDGDGSPQHGEQG